MDQKPASTQAVAPKVKTWADMSKEERAVLSATKKASAMAKVTAKEFPSGIRFSLGRNEDGSPQHTLTAKPSGVSEKGSVSYSYAGQTIQVGPYKVRINRVSFSVLNEHEDEGLPEDVLPSI